MLFRDIYKILIVSEPQGANTPMRRNGEAIVRHLIDTHHIKVDIVRNAIIVANRLGISQPKVAILAAAEMVNPKIPSTLDAASLSKMADRL